MTADPTRLPFSKGHGTRNDFVLLADTRGELDLTPELVRALADRRGGIGADGVIRLVPTAQVAESARILAEDPGAIWFMDYRNADGSIAEMCGNGIRVFAAFAHHLGLVSFADGGDVAIGTRAGVRRVRREADGWFAVDMGRWSYPGGADAVAAGHDVAVAVPGESTPRPALRVDVGNPHTVVALANPGLLAAADLGRAPRVNPEPAAGTNVELAVPLGEVRNAAGEVWGRVRMRVHERGVGETASCGTGACAAALAVRAWAGDAAPDAWLVDVPGGSLRVRVNGSRVELAGPAELVFHGEVNLAGGGPAADQAPQSVRPAVTESTR